MPDYHESDVPKISHTWRGEFTRTEYGVERPFHHGDTGEVVSTQVEPCDSLTDAIASVGRHESVGWHGVRVVERTVTASATEWRTRRDSQGL